MQNFHSAFLVTLLFTLLTACETVTEPIIEKAPVVQEVKTIKPSIILSAEAIRNPPKSDVFFAQKSLKSLGYAVGFIDGIWGEQSASAIRLFEKNHNIESANGQLSSLNLYTLRNTNKPLLKIKKNPTNTSTISSKLNSATPTRSAPVLIIIEQTYPLMSKANPYSHVVTQLESGSGIYILSLQNGWYEVETLSKQLGFIREN